MTLVLIGVPLSNPVHPFYPDLVHGSTTSMIPTNHSHIYLAHVDCNHVHGGDVSQLREENIESLMPDIFQPQSLIGEEEGLTSRPTQASSLINPSS